MSRNAENFNDDNILILYFLFTFLLVVYFSIAYVVFIKHKINK